ncbi:alpha/beta hydrolase [Thalassotalea psychrophila]|uniref:Alpha/beta hydrolase n=1 Tax=Thalassotalea psychrophila TaxID=3065647 RepID=A0ABY9TV16_9GAMM|nr:alpha/beta hydrolase [Colwelliaceae bacterium SQ149]
MRKKLYLIPGTMCTEELWVKLIPYLSNSFELVYLDIPREKNFDELAEHYSEMFANEKVYLMGFSLGGYIASYFSMLHPERVEKLFVISNSPTSLPKEELNQRDDILKFVKKNGYQGISRNRVVSLLDGHNQTDYFVDLVIKMDKELGGDEFISQYQFTSQRVDLFQALSHVSFITHFYYSDGDRLINPQWFNKLRTVNPKLSIISTSGSGHMLPLEKPCELASYIKSWIEL